MSKPKLKVLELFAGSRSIGKEAEKRGHQVFSSDINNFPGINYPVNILEFDTSAVPFIPDIIWASPPCTTVSIAAISHHYNEDQTPKTEAAIIGQQIFQKTKEIIEFFLKKNPNLCFYIENPRGLLRKLPIYQNFDRTTVWYCQYGDSRAKPTDIWTNNLHSLFNPHGWKPKPECWNGRKNCHDEAPRGARTGTQGLKGNYNRSKIPQQLCADVIIATETKMKLNTNLI